MSSNTQWPTRERLSCDVCGVHNLSQPNMTQHLNGKKHLSKLTSRRKLTLRKDDDDDSSDGASCTLPPAAAAPLERGYHARAVSPEKRGRFAPESSGGPRDGGSARNGGRAFHDPPQPPRPIAPGPPLDPRMHPYSRQAPAYPVAAGPSYAPGTPQHPAAYGSQAPVSRTDPWQQQPLQQRQEQSQGHYPQSGGSSIGFHKADPRSGWTSPQAPGTSLSVGPKTEDAPVINGPLANAAALPGHSQQVPNSPRSRFAWRSSAPSCNGGATPGSDSSVFEGVHPQGAGTAGPVQTGVVGTALLPTTHPSPQSVGGSRIDANARQLASGIPRSAPMASNREDTTNNTMQASHQAPQSHVPAHTERNNPLRSAPAAAPPPFPMGEKMTKAHWDVYRDNSMKASGPDALAFKIVRDMMLLPNRGLVLNDIRMLDDVTAQIRGVLEPNGTYRLDAADFPICDLSVPEGKSGVQTEAHIGTLERVNTMAMTALNPRYQSNSEGRNDGLEHVGQDYLEELNAYMDGVRGPQRVFSSQYGTLLGRSKSLTFDVTDCRGGSGNALTIHSMRMGTPKVDGNSIPESQLHESSVALDPTWQSLQHPLVGTQLNQLAKLAKNARRKSL